MRAWRRTALRCARCATWQGEGRSPGSIPPMLRMPSLMRVCSSLCCLACRAHGVSPSYPVLLDASGSYSEGMLRGLDYLLAEAGSRGLKVRCSSS